MILASASVLYFLNSLSSYSSRHRTVDIWRLTSLCPNLKQLSVTGSFISWRPDLIHQENLLSGLQSLSLKDISMEGDQSCWKRAVNIDKISISSGGNFLDKEHASSPSFDIAKYPND